jgi:hypothetical protein
MIQVFIAQVMLEHMDHMEHMEHMEVLKVELYLPRRDFTQLTHLFKDQLMVRMDLTVLITSLTALLVLGQGSINQGIGEVMCMEVREGVSMILDTVIFREVLRLDPMGAIGGMEISMIGTVVMEVKGIN